MKRSMDWKRVEKEKYFQKGAFSEELVSAGTSTVLCRS